MMIPNRIATATEKLTLEAPLSALQLRADPEPRERHAESDRRCGDDRDAEAED